MKRLIVVLTMTKKMIFVVNNLSMITKYIR